MNFDLASLLIGFFAGVLIMLIVYARSRGAELTAEIEALQQKLTSTEGSLAESQDAAAAAKKETKAVSRDLKKAQKELEKGGETAEALAEAKAQIGELEGQLADCRAKVADLEASAAAEPAAEAEPVPQPATLSAASLAADAPAEEEVELTLPREPKPKDLQVVEGIGPKIAELLIAAGIYDLADLAQAAVDKLQDILVAAGSRYKLADPSTWPEQATIATQGTAEELQKFQDELKGGRRAI